jgi:hypothetical protein
MRVKKGEFIDSIYSKKDIGFKLFNDCQRVILAKSIAPHIVYMLRFIYNLDEGYRLGRGVAEYRFDRRTGG